MARPGRRRAIGWRRYRRRRRWPRCRARSSRRAEGDLRADGTAGPGAALELERAVELANTLAHADQAHASGIARMVGDETDAIIGDRQANDAVAAHQPDANLFRLRMLRNVAERFLHDAVDGQRGSWRQLVQVGVRLAGDGDAARLAELSAVGGYRVRQPRFLQHGGMQLVRELTDVRSDLDQSVLQGRDFGLCPRVRWNLVHDGSQIEAERRELLEDAVVQLARNAAPLLFLRFHQALVQRRDLRLMPLQQSLMPLEDTDADAMDRPEERQCSDDAESTEPGRLVENRRNREVDERAFFVPHAAVVAGRHAESVIHWREVRVVRVAWVDGHAPVAVLPLELDPEAHLFRHGQAQRGVVDDEISDARRQPQAPAAGCGRVVDLAVRGDLLDVHRRWGPARRDA